MAELVLASGSPRRRELLGRLGLAFAIRVPRLDETPLPGESPTACVERLARAKALVCVGHDEVVLGADTAVDLDGTMLGKPIDPDHAREMLAALSGRSHEVHTGVAVVVDEQVSSCVTTTGVTFRRLSAAEINAYVESATALDKAGSYSIQGGAGDFLTSVAGSLSNVVGLPLAQTAAMLTRAGISCISWGPPRG